MEKKFQLTDKQMHLKTEFAEETGVDISQFNQLNKGSLTSRQNGYVGGAIGGTMTKKLVEMAEDQLSGYQGKL